MAVTSSQTEIQTALRLGAATLNQTPLDLEGNTGRILAAIAVARSNGVQLLVLPELCVTGYGCEDAFFRPGLCGKALSVLINDIAPATKGMICTAGLPVIHDGALFNAVALLVDGRIAGINAKRRLPRDGVHYEPRWFRPWPDGRMAEVDVDGQKIPFGDLVYEVCGVRLALEICEEAWGAVPAAACAAGFADIVLNPSASHFALGKYETREHLVANSSRSFGVYYIYSNMVGLEAGRVIYDGGCMVACDGKLIARGDRFSFNDHDLVVAEANVDLVRSSKMRKGSFSGGGPGQIGASPVALNVVKLPGAQIDTYTVDPPQDALIARMTHLSAEEEFLRAECLGLFDYLRKSGAQGFALSLSGGCDSAVCAVLVAEMQRAAISALGEAAFCQRLRLLDSKMESLLLCVWQSTSNSSEATHAAARDVADEVGARFVEVDVEPAVDFYRSQAERITGRKLEWSRDDLALQNIQSRARAPMVWLLANLENRLLLTTANRSEAATGYTTMDGDSAGGLAPLAGIDKAFLLRWARWASSSQTPGRHPWKSLQAVLSRPPTAELRPPSSGQTDEADLMPYQVLAVIEGCRVRDKLSTEETVAAVLRAISQRRLLLASQGPIDPNQIRGWVDRFDQLWRASQWKRERFAPGFHLDDFSVDSRGFCRFPIFSGAGT